MKKQKGLATATLVLSIGIIVLLVLYYTSGNQPIFMELVLIGLGVMNMINGVAKWQSGKSQMGLTVIAFGLIIGGVGCYTMLTRMI